jgi:hypothetical protein
MAGTLIVALAPLPAVWEFVRYRFLSSDIAVIMLPVVLACFAMCSSPPGARRLRRVLDRARKPPTVRRAGRSYGARTSGSDAPGRGAEQIRPWSRIR